MPASEPAVALDRAGITVFRDTSPLQAARQVNAVVRRRFVGDNAAWGGYRMSDRLEFAGGNTTYTVTRNGAPITWAWADDGRGVGAAYKGYYNRNGFFAVIWQVNLPRNGQPARPVWTNSVRLQVESPTEKVDRLLNDLKLEVVRAILNSNVREMVLDAGFAYDTQRLKTSDEDVRQHQTTTLFRVVMKDEQKNLSPEEKIKTVHEAIGSKVSEVVTQFTEKLEKRFPRK